MDVVTTPAPGYAVTDLGLYPGDTSAEPVGISALGEVVANCFGPTGGPGTPSAMRGCVLGPSPGQARLLPRLASASHMNLRGDVVGTALDVCGNPRAAVVWHSGEFQFLDGPTGPCYPGEAPSSEARSINDLGEILVGTSQYSPGGFLTDGSHRTALAQLSPCGLLYPRAINNRGQVVGAEDLGCGGSTGWPSTHAYLYEKGRAFDLGNIAFQTELDAVNELGMAVGVSRDNRSPDQAAIFDDAGLRPLISDAGYDSITAVDINDQGTVVGWFSSTSPGGPAGSFVWSGGVLTVLDGVVAHANVGAIYNVVGINRFGQIAAIGAVNGEPHVVRLDPTSPSGAPVALVLGGPFRGSVPTQVAFDGRRSAGAGGVVSYAWDFGDGTTALGALVHHTYTAAGDYTVTLIVTDALGASATASQVVTARASLDVPGPARAAARPGTNARRQAVLPH